MNFDFLQIVTAAIFGWGAYHLLNRRVFLAGGFSLALALAFALSAVGVSVSDLLFF